MSLPEVNITPARSLEQLDELSLDGNSTAIFGGKRRNIGLSNKSDESRPSGVQRFLDTIKSFKSLFTSCRSKVDLHEKKVNHISKNDQEKTGFMAIFSRLFSCFGSKDKNDLAKRAEMTGFSNQHVEMKTKVESARTARKNFGSADNLLLNSNSLDEDARKNFGSIDNLSVNTITLDLNEKTVTKISEEPDDNLSVNSDSLDEFEKTLTKSSEERDDSLALESIEPVAERQNDGHSASDVEIVETIREDLGPI